jgi:hypothetical protein
MAKERHISMGPGFRYDTSKTPEENNKARKEYYKKLGIDVRDITPEEERKILDEAKKQAEMIADELTEA